MKGVILDCIAGMVKTKLGEDKWEEILLGAGFSKHTVFLPFQDVPEEYFDRIHKSILRATGLNEKDASTYFGEYWMQEYAPQFYPNHFQKLTNARDFLLKMDEVHRRVTQEIPYSNPPHFEYEWQGEKALLMRYHSSRRLMEVFEGLVKAVGKYFKEDLQIEKADETTLRITFP